MKRIVTLLISLLVATACNNSATEFNERPHGVISIAHLKSLATSESYRITDDISIEGYVVANDLYGEYYKSIIISDDSGGIEIAIDTRKTATQFPISARIVVYCSRLSIGDYGGKLTLGATPEGSYSVDRIAEKDILRYFLVDKSAPKATKPTTVSINEIDSRHIGNYIRLDDVSFTSQAGLTWCDKDPITGDYITTERTIYDREKNSFTVRCIAECRYNNEKLPSGYGTLCGIIECFNGKYSLRVVNHQIHFK